MSKHTPGPWMIAPCSEDDESFDIVSEYEPQSNGTVRANWIAQVDIQDENHPGENLANARLIAAAPELLEALKLMLKFEASFGENDIPDEDRDYARAVITKAEGR